RRPLCSVVYTTSPWHIAMPLGEDGNHPICQATLGTSDRVQWVWFMMGVARDCRFVVDFDEL
ncbi:hypothetical protein, partial [Mesorhizobium sp. M0643]|uniref:hypothetical protein n=1 Tax=Mesorhizobium sp. M0643 TaxID=2956978 RepID=UPI00333C6EFA